MEKEVQTIDLTEADMPGAFLSEPMSSNTSLSRHYVLLLDAATLHRHFQTLLHWGMVHSFYS